jgi:hypothetical protein
MKTKTFIKAIRTETLGFRLGEPWRYSDKNLSVILPIIRVSELKPNYIVLAKATKVKIEDTGKIEEVSVLNNEDVPVYIRLGEIFRGKTQERTAIMSYIIPPKEKRIIQVNCVHASKGISSGAIFHSAGYVPKRDSNYIMSNTGERIIGQSQSWAMDINYSQEIKTCGYGFAISNVQADDLAAVRDAVDKEFSNILKEVPLFDNQIGMAMIDDKGFYLLDCFDLFDSWKDVKESIVGKESLAIVKEDQKGVFEYKPQNAKEMVKKVLEKAFIEKEIYSDNGGKTIALSTDTIVGEVTLLNDKVVHLILTRK